LINTAPMEKRVSMLKPQCILQEMDDDDENIYCSSLLDRYVARPNELENMCLAEFAAIYTVTSSSRRDEQNINIDLGSDDED